MAGNIKGITIEIGGDTTKLEKALKSVNTTSREVNKELREINTSLKFNPGNTELLTQKQRALGSAIENTKKKLEQLKTAQEQAAAALERGDIGQDEYDALRREIIKTENQLKSLEGQLNALNSKWVQHGQALQEVGGKLQTVGRSITEVGQNLTTKLTVPIVAVGTAAAKLAVDFESAMAGVAKTVDMTEEEFESMSQAIRDMSKELPATTTEIAAVAEAAGQLGIEKENILSFTRTMIDLGESTNLTADQAATSFARFANITQMPQSEFDKLGSTVVALGNNFATTESEIVELGMRLAGTGSQIGLTQAEIMGLATAMSSVGVSAEAGGTAMSMTLNKMNNAIAGSKVAMEDIGYAAYEVGIPVEKFIQLLNSGSEGIKALEEATGYQKDVIKDLAKAYDDAVIPLEGFIAIAEKGGMAAEEFVAKWETSPAEVLSAFVLGLAQVNEEGGNVNLTLDQLGISGVRETDTLNRLSNAANLLPQAFQMANAAFEENSALSDEASKRYATMQSQLDMTINKLKDVGITIGEIIMPRVMEFVDWLGQLTEKFAGLNPATQEMIVNLAAIAAAVGPVMLVFGPFVTLIGKMVSGLGVLASAWGVAFAGATAATPVIASVAAGLTKLAAVFAAVQTGIVAFAAAVNLPVAALAAIGVAVAALVALVIKNWDEIKAKTSEVWNALKTTIETSWENIKTKTSEVWNSIKENLTTLWENIKSTADEKFNALKTNVEQIWDNIKNSAKTKWEEVKKMITDPIDEAKTHIKNALDAISRFFSNLKLEFPKIKLPHFRISGSFSLNPPSVPSFGVDWYDKGGIFTGPSIIGVGEKRPEFVGALDDLKNIVAEVINKEGNNSGGVLVTGNTFVVREESDIKKIAEELNKLQQRNNRGMGLVTV